MKGSISFHIEETDGSISIASETNMDLTDPAAALLATAILRGAKEAIAVLDPHVTYLPIPA